MTEPDPNCIGCAGLGVIDEMDEIEGAPPRPCPWCWPDDEDPDA